MYVGERVKIVGCSRYKFTRPTRLIGKEGTIASYVGHSPGLVVHFYDGEQDAFYKDELELVSAEQVAGGVMAKCRTCEAASEVLTCAHEWSCDEEFTSCEDHKPRETPLLVDVLGAALKNVWGGRFTDGDTSGQYPSGCERPGYTVLLTPEQCEIIRAALARHKEEVGDAKA